MLCAAAPASAATTWHVTDAGDATGTTCTAAPAQCTLRDAVNDAVDGDTILIDPGIDPALTSGISLGKDLTIEGQGAAATTISGNGSNVIFVLPVVKTVVIKDVELTGGGRPLAADETGGEPGGAIFNDADLTLDRVLLDNNHAQTGGPGPSGPAGPGGPGGAIYSGGDLTILDSTIRNNSAGDGGGGGTGAGDGGDGGGILVNGGTTTISGTTIANNSAGLGGIAITGGAGGSGGGIDFVGGAFAASITNSTITNNSSGPGGTGSTGGAGGPGGGIDQSSAAAVVLTNTTIAGNLTGAGGVSGMGGQGPEGTGGGTSGAMTLQNSLLAGNTPTNCGAGVVDGLHNIGFNDPSCPAGFADANPALGSLQNNGGPTDTLALGAGSAALNQVPTTGANCPATDQRGVTRPQGTACDIGAFELAVPPVVTPIPTPTPAPTTTTKKKCKKGFKLVKKHGKKKCKKKKKR
jgi:hypothetical protein